MPKTVEGFLFAFFYPYPTFLTVLGKPCGDMIRIAGGGGFLQVREEPLLLHWIFLFRLL